MQISPRDPHIHICIYLIFLEEVHEFALKIFILPVQGYNYGNNTGIVEWNSHQNWQHFQLESCHQKVSVQTRLHISVITPPTVHEEQPSLADVNDILFLAGEDEKPIYHLGEIPQ